MPYIMIHSRDWVTQYEGNTNPLRLRVIQTDGIKVTPDDQIKVTNLKRGKNNTLYKHFLNTGDGGITFKINVMIHKDEVWDELLVDDDGLEVVKYPLVTDILRRWYTGMTVLNVVTDFIDIPDGNYVITKNPSRSQSNIEYTVWELEFTTYRAVNTVRYANNNSAVTNAIAKAKKANAKKNTKAAAKKTTKSASSSNSKLAKCALSQLKYSKKQKTVTCVKYMQTVLYKKGYLTKRQIDGWYGPKTVNAVKKFQKRYKKTYNLKVTVKIDNNTKNAMCKV